MPILTDISKCLFAYMHICYLTNNIVYITHMNKITNISHSFRARDQFYRLLTVRFAFQILNVKDQSNQVKRLYRALRFGYLSQAHTAAVCLLAANLSLTPAYHALVRLTERPWRSLIS